MNRYLGTAALLHAGFAVAELCPWRSPYGLKRALERLPAGTTWSEPQSDLVAAVVHNAGIYNAVFAAGLLWSAARRDRSRDTARVLLAGAAAAGVFGTATLKSPLTAVQAAVGIGGLIGLSRGSFKGRRLRSRSHHSRDDEPFVRGVAGRWTLSRSAQRRVEL